MPQEAHPVQVMLVEPVIIPPTAQGRLGHVQVHHMLGTAGNRRNRKAAGVGE
ncbi:hypothetical protein D9M69_700360 [compost metagenome]